MSFEFIIFDLDNTLYPHDSGVMEEIGTRIQVWVRNQLELSWEEATSLRHQYLRQYGTTMGGLMTEHDVDVSRYLSFVHDIAIEDYLKPNPELREMLAGIPLRKVVYTNATSEHGRRVLQALDIADQFEQVIGIQEVGLQNKVSREAYERTLALLGAEGEACIMVEDSPRNLPPAKSLGLTTILIDAEEGTTFVDVPDRCIDIATDSVLDVGRVVQQLLEEREKAKDGSEITGLAEA